MPGREQRKLAAILAADVVGYSRLMEADERDTFERVKSMLENVIAPAVDQHGGQIVKTTGDSLLADFASAVEEVECAVVVQPSLANLEKAETPEHRLQLRIGISISDIILTDDDIFGDGVNIAARLEGIAPPGGICVSDQVAGHIALSTAHILCNDHNLALAKAHLAVRLNPNDPVGLHALGNKSDLAGDAEGIARIVLAQQLNRRDPGLYRHQTFLARAYVNALSYEAAIAKSHDAVNAHPEFAEAHCILAVALAHAGRLDEAATTFERCEQLSSGLVERRRKWRPYTDEPRNMHLKDGLEKAIAAMKAVLERGRLDDGSE